MFMRTYRRSSKQRYYRAAALVLGVLLLLDFFSLLKGFHDFSHNLLSHTYTDISTLPSPAQNQKIFICAQFWTSADVIQESWGDAILKLVQALGVENVYLSIYESGSLDNTKEVLMYLESILAELGVPRTVVLDPKSHADEIAVGPIDSQGNPRSGWIQTKTGTSGKELRRIPYLARLRNTGLQPLFTEQKAGRVYDKILYLNDVHFRNSDVFSLLATNQGSYSAACSMDYHLPPDYYDTFALRDSRGDGSVMTRFPYFRSRESRHAMMQGLPSRVTSCWNGMIVMDATPFYNDAVTASEGLRFRGIKDSLASMHLEGSECCLIHADLAAMGAAKAGIYLNPSVRVGYTALAYNLTHTGPQQSFVTATEYITGAWINRVRRTIFLFPTPRVIKKRLKRWKKEGANSLENRVEPGEFCLIDETHTLLYNGWRHA